MFKKLNLSSPLGIALTVAGLALALSPEARKAVRRWMVKGTAGVMDTMEQVGGVTASMIKSRQPVSWKSETNEMAPLAPSSYDSTAAYNNDELKVQDSVSHSDQTHPLDTPPSDPNQATH